MVLTSQLRKQWQFTQQQSTGWRAGDFLRSLFRLCLISMTLNFSFLPWNDSKRHTGKCSVRYSLNEHSDGWLLSFSTYSPSLSYCRKKCGPDKVYSSDLSCIHLPCCLMYFVDQSTFMILLYLLRVTSIIGDLVVYIMALPS